MRITLCAVLAVAAALAPAAVAAAAPATALRDLAKRLNDAAHALERNDPVQALQQAEAAAGHAGAAGDAEALARAHLHRSHALRLLGRHGEALVAGEQARDRARSARAPAAEAAALANLAVLYETGGLEAEALALHRQALDMFEQLGRREAVASTLLNLGNLFDSRNELAEAAAAYRRALQIKREIGAPGAGAALSNLALIALRRGQPAEALQLLDEAMAAHDSEGNVLGTALALGNQASALVELGRMDEAGAALDRAGRMVGDGSQVLAQSAIHEGRAELLGRRAADARDPQLLQQALAANDAALRLATDAEASRRARLQRQRAGLLEQAGDAAGALAALRESVGLFERERQLENDRRYAVLAAHFDSSRQRERIEALQEGAVAVAGELSRQRSLRDVLLAGAVLMGLLACLLWLRNRRRRRSEEQLDAHNRSLSTALQAAERERANAEDAERVNRELLRVAAEELRVPLASALGSAERLLAMVAEQPPLRRDAAGIADTLQHLVHVVTDLVESAELERHDVQLVRDPVDLAHLLRGVCAHWGLRASERRQQLDCAAPEQLQVTGDPARLREAIEHLVSNALRFTPSGKRIAASLERDGDDAVLRVRDQGPGLREEDRQRVFGKLQRAPTRGQRTEPGAGLGLWMVRRIAELHGGNVEAMPSPAGEGSEFVLRLPAGDDPAPPRRFRQPGDAATAST